MSSASKRKSEDDEAVCVGCGGSFTRLNLHLSRRPKCRRLRQAHEAHNEQVILTAAMGSVMDTSFQDVMRTTVVSDLSDFRHGRQKKIVSGTVVDGFKECVSSWLASAEAGLVNALESHVSPESGIDVAELVHSRLDIFNGIHTAKLEERELIHNILGGRHVEPRRRSMPGHDTDCVWDLPLVEQLQATITYDPSAAAQIIESSQRWSRVSTPTPLGERTWRDIEHGEVFETHSKLGATADALPCAISGGDATLTAWKAYYDEVDSTNPLGVARGHHSIGCFYVSCINFDPATRNRLEKTFLVCLALNSVVKKYGMLAVLAGALPDGSLAPGCETSLGGQMRALDKGVVLDFPATEAYGSAHRRTTYGWTIMMSADYPAAAKMLCTSQSTSSKAPCRNCNWQKDSQFAYASCTFVNRQSRTGFNRWQLRSLESFEDVINEAQLQPTKGKSQTVMREAGIYADNFAFNPTYFPHLDNPFKSEPQDGMHNLFSSGVANSGLAEVLHNLITVEKEFTLEELNTRIHDYPHWPPGSKPPPIHASVLTGAGGGMPAAGCSVRYTGSQTMHFCLHSRAVLEPLVHTSGPVWKMWLAMVDVVERYVAESFTLRTIMDLDGAIAKYLRLYQAVPQFRGRMRPKHHFLTHTASDIINFGPPRQFWCFGYEAKNQEVKRAACASNFKDVIKSATRTMSLQAAKSLHGCIG